MVGFVGFRVGFGFGGVRYVSSNPPHNKNSLHSCPSDIENAPHICFEKNTHLKSA